MRRHVKSGAAAVAAVGAAFVLPRIAEDVVIHPVPDTVTQRIVMRTVFAVLVFVVVRFGITFVAGLRAGAVLYRRWLIAAACYLFVAGVVLVALWPGYWIWDEWGVLEGVEAGGLPLWQGVITAGYYTVAMYLFPSPVILPVLQVIVAALVVGWIVARTAEMLRRPRLAYLLVVSFLTFPVLLNNAYPLRLTTYSYIELIVLFRLAFIVLRPALVTNRYREFIGLSAGITLLALWRSEGMYYFLLIPVLFLVLRIYQARGREALRAIVSTVAVVTLVGCSFQTNKENSDPSYQLTAIVNPLSLMLQEPLQGDVQGKLAAIDRVIDVKVVAASPTPYDVAAIWAGAVRKDFEPYLPGAMRAFAGLVRDNPGPFMRARAKTYLASNSMDFIVPQVLWATTYTDHDESRPRREQAEQRDLFMHPVSERLRAKAVRTLLMLNADNKPTLLGRLTWNTIPVTALLAVLLMVAAMRRRWLYVGIASLILVRVPLLFLTQPASFFMYFLPVYLSGCAFMFFAAIRFADARLDGRRPLPEAATTATALIPDVAKV